MLDQTLDARAARLNDRYKHHAATEVLRRALRDPDLGDVTMVSSFGSESVVLLHMVSVVAPGTPVLFIDTQMLFQETLDYQIEVAEKLQLTDVRVIRATEREVALNDPDGTLHQFNTDACCDFRKTIPLERELSKFDAWITGRKRFQGGQRTELEFFESEPPSRLRINPLARWTTADLAAYMRAHDLRENPLVAYGYLSIGCFPCTQPVRPGEDARSGRWSGQAKTECGIHLAGLDAALAAAPH